MKVPNLQEATRCECCGIIIGNYYNKKIVKTKYSYPILITHKDKGYVVDIGCYFAIVTGQVTPRFNALYDPDLYS